MADSAAPTATSKDKKEHELKELESYEVRMLDPVQSAIGTMGSWQIRICGLLFLVKFPIAWHQMAIIFLGPPAKFSCISPANITNQCSKDCTEIEYDRSVFSQTITMEWNLICSGYQLVNLSQTLFMLGVLCGNISFGMWSDVRGRRIPLLVSVSAQGIAGVITSFANYFWLFCVLRFITAVATGGTMLMSYVIIMEVIGSQWRELITSLFQIPFNLGHLTLPLFGYFIRDWRKFQFALSIPSAILISYYWFITESPRWLFAKGRIDSAARILEKAARMNERHTEYIHSDLEEGYKRKHINDTNNQDSKGNMLDLFKTPKLRKRTIIICYNWFICGFSYFGVAQYIGQISGDIFVNVAIGGALGIPGTASCIFLLKCFGRRHTLIGANLLTGTAMLCIAFVPHGSILVVILAAIGLLGSASCFVTVYLFTAELFPTVVRSVGLGLGSMVARIGSMIAPFVAGLPLSIYWLPPVIFGIIPIIGAGLVFWLPETKGQTLPETIQDGENI